MNLKDLEEIICQKHVRSHWNIYEWIRKHPDTTIANAVFRTRRIFNRSDMVMVGVSGGKDSTLSMELICLEVNYRRELSKAIANGDISYDLIIPSHYNKYGELEAVSGVNGQVHIPKIFAKSQDAEIMYTSPIKHVQRSCVRHGYGLYLYKNKVYLGQDVLPSELQKPYASCFFELVLDSQTPSESYLHFLSENIRDIPGSFMSTDGTVVELIHGGRELNFFYLCIEEAFQSGASYNEGKFMAWSEDSEWVRPMPTREEFSVDIIKTTGNDFNALPISTLNRIGYQDFVNHNKDYTIQINGLDCIPFWGLGNRTSSYKGYEDLPWNLWYYKGQPEDSENGSMQNWICESVPDGYQIYNFISLRAHESLDRRLILKKGDYYLGHYGTRDVNSKILTH